MSRLSYLLLVSFIFLLNGSLFSQTMPVPVEVQYPLLLKIISFDRNFNSKIHNNIIIGVVYQERNRNSKGCAESFIDAADNSPIKTALGKQVILEMINISNTAEGLRKLNSGGYSILYITPLRAFELSKITAIANEIKILTFTGVPEYVDEGIAVGIGISGNNPRIVINITSALSAGCDFHPQLLKISRVVE